MHLTRTVPCLLVGDELDEVIPPTAAAGEPTPGDSN